MTWTFPTPPSTICGVVKAESERFFTDLLPKRQVKKETKHKSRHATLYDALEDRIKKRHATGFIRPEDEVQRNPQSHRRGAQSRYAAHPSVVLASRLGIEVSEVIEPPSDLHLSRTDLLNAIHGYASSILTLRGPNEDSSNESICVQDFNMEPFMDETALLAFGVIAEEMARDLIGETGHLVLAENSGLALLPEDLSTSHHEVKSMQVQELKVLDAPESSDNGARKGIGRVLDSTSPERLYRSTANFPPFDLDPQSLNVES